MFLTQTEIDRRGAQCASGCGQAAERGAAHRAAAEAKGRRAEDRVAELFEEAGFTVLARRLRTGAGELDLVVADGRTLVFVEVKARDTFSAAAYAVPVRAQARLFEAASLALARFPNWARADTRFDVALVTPGGVQVIADAIRYQ